ncbi:hypothetical protein ACFFUT_07325 [Pseudohalocynthiibacter aestuariivivens]|jgi:hypothetical protein|uniref:Uncharacterized protein n=1 Tax=Pseudohalocynthiibacter aestuariivivens TaxID=1591409 RepID=A0ABV5JE04_9RHOB|nr:MULTISPECIES: hypothetical protein [Pseudohalocynthiibacter]MBS9718000.1 hypothetical protein [Pseudohalocynthiibacter aestuariivivens]MCK0103172.1 hypothetical protein [Pseudohalocynthiibacter sp. F2068]
MVLDFIEVDDAIKKRDLEQIELLLKDDIFLKAIGINAQQMEKPEYFSVLTDVKKAHEMMTSQEIWDLPEPWPFQYFVGVVEDEAGRLKYENGLVNEERLRLGRVFRSKFDDFSRNFFEIVSDSFRRNEVRSFLASTLEGVVVDEQNFQEIINVFFNEIHNYISRIIEGICYAGMDQSPLFKQMYKAFLTGGIPCGWIGPLPEDGGEPSECLQILHFGGALH